MSILFEVIKWEFSRWFKLKEHLITILVGTLISGAIFGGIKIYENKMNKEVKISVLNEEDIPLLGQYLGRIKFNRIKKADLFKEIEKVKSEAIDGVLIISNYEKVKLFINDEPKWIKEVQAEIDKNRQKVKIEDSKISKEELSDIFKGVKLEYNFTKEQSIKAGESEKIAAMVFTGIMLIGVFFGLAYQFTAITGEKQLRITEVIVSAISPQTWIDGKIIGISLLSIAMVLTYMITSVLFTIISSFLGSGWNIPFEVLNPGLIVLLLLFTFLGFVFWNTFFSAIAATINDPNTSARGSLIMVPIIPIVLGFMALSNPDTLLMKVLSVIPITASPIINARLVAGNVHPIEIILALTFLILSIWGMRKTAGRIFEYSILIYGKEPSWNEMIKWIVKKN